MVVVVTVIVVLWWMSGVGGCIMCSVHDGHIGCGGGGDDGRSHGSDGG